MMITPGFKLSWETVMVATEIVAALGSSLCLLCRNAGATRAAAQVDPPLLTQPRGSWCSLAALFRFRLAALAFYVGVQLYNIYRTRFLCLIFYTSWNFIAQGVYFAVAAMRTRRTLLRARGGGYAALLEHPAGPGSPIVARVVRGRGHTWLTLELALDVCLSTSLLISIVVWTILYPYTVKVHRPEALLNPVSYCQHALNLVVLQIDFFCSRHHVSLRALPLMIAWPTVYTVFTWILHGTIAKGFWPYPFLQVDTPYAPLWYGGLLAAHIFALTAMYALSRLKKASTGCGEIDAAA